MTILANAQDKLLTMGDLYYCTDTVDFSLLTKLTSTNQSTVKTELDLLNFSTVGHINNFSIAHSLQNEEIIRAGNCGVGELARLIEKTPTITFTWLDVNNRPVFDKMLGLDLLNVAAAPVSITGESVGSAVSQGTIYRFVNKNGDGTEVASIVVTDGTGALTLHTDYEVGVDADGYTYIVILVTTTGATTVDYDYTPNASTLDGYNIEKAAVPYGLYKFVSCKSQINSNGSDNAVQDTIYFRKYVLSGDLVENYILLSEDSTFEGSEASFVGVNGGGYLKEKAIVTM